MQVTFLLGPAGSGKTWRCLAEIRAALQASPEGPPLLLLAPKQATFQLERQLLADPDLSGYTRLQIVSFERLAEFILNQIAAPPRLLDEEGRVMVLRALLARVEREKQLRTFHATARLPGFAQHLSLLLRELQRHQFSDERLLALAAQPGLAPPLAAKLHDLAILLRAYLDWLREHGLEDANRLLDLATAALRATDAAFRIPHSAFHLSALWLDGFAEMTPQELDLLAVLVPRCDHATLAFCLDREPLSDVPWLSTWSVVAQTYRQCRSRLEALPRCQPSLEILPRRADQNRFSESPALAHLERHWANQASATTDPASDICVTACANPEAEAILAAHEILRHVRTGGRFRECAVLVRSLDGYHDALRRVFARYDIPFFLDRREPIAHHPLAELTRSALRTVAFGWRQDDWFAVLKTGLLPAREEELDWLENAALEHGWEGATWREPLRAPSDDQVSRDAERLRQRLVPPFVALFVHLTELQFQPTGAQLADALRALWETLEAERQLAEWTNRTEGEAHSAFRTPRSALHETVWDQMQNWLDNLARAFPAEALPLREWLPILEAGLSGLTVGVIPPALDQVLLGAIDRSRNPDLQLALVLGLNEGVFPAPPPPAVLLTDSDRETLEDHRVFLGPNRKLRLGHERYFGYIACTRARRRLVLTYAASDADGATLNPSLFVDHIQRLFPELVGQRVPPVSISGGTSEELSVNQPSEGRHSCRPAPQPAATGKSPLPGSPSRRAVPEPETLPESETDGTRCPTTAPTWLFAEHASELAAPLLRNKTLPPAAQVQSLAALEALPVFAPLVEKWRKLTTAAGQSLRLSAPERLFGQELSTSVSALEDYAACPFKFFVGRGLRAEERKRFEMDERERGTFQHEALREFHQRLRNQGRRWRDLPVVEACVMIRNIGEDLRTFFRDGLFESSDAARFHAEVLITQLEKLIAVLIEWAPQYEFDPLAAEVDFGFPGVPLPAWRLALDAGRALLLRGRIDRIDFCVNADTEEALAAVIDYKSTVRPLDATKLHHGLQLQLLSYLGVLRHLENPRESLGVARVVPAGVFYVGLRGGGGSGATRAEAIASREDARKSGYQHAGRFNAALLRQFDNRSDANSGDQFRYRLNKDGALHGNSIEAMPEGLFSELLDSVEEHLRRIGREILAGETRVSPFRKNTETACQYCEFRAVCRFDPWVEPYRVLRPPPKKV